MKERLDVLLVQKGFFPSREKAKTSIIAGLGYVDGQISDKAGTKIDVDAEITVKGDQCPYVSRGGLKLEKSMTSFSLDLHDRVCMDIGASTGGFTDCMLQNGARKVYAIDVGYGQLAWKLRTDPRVVNIEKCNVRYLDTTQIQEPINFISIDVSFISLRLIFPVAAQVLAEDGEIVCLVKPQFEAGRDQVGKNGIVRDPAVHEEVIRRVCGYAEDNGFGIDGLTYSPVTGAKGNIEYLLHIGKKKDLRYNLDEAHNVVQHSHSELK